MIDAFDVHLGANNNKIDREVLNKLVSPTGDYLFNIIYDTQDNNIKSLAFSGIKIKFVTPTTPVLGRNSFVCTDNSPPKLRKGVVNMGKYGVDCSSNPDNEASALVNTGTPLGTGGKKSRKSTSKTRKPKTLKRPLRANHRIKKATSVESRKRVSKNRNTSYRRA